MAVSRWSRTRRSALANALATWREHTQAQAQAQAQTRAQAQAHAQARARVAWERQQQELQRAARKQLALKKLEVLNRRMATLTNQNTVGGVFECRVPADVNLLFCAVFMSKLMLSAR